jgi:hypothetical protein
MELNKYITICIIIQQSALNWNWLKFKLQNLTYTNFLVLNQNWIWSTRKKEKENYWIIVKIKVAQAFLAPTLLGPAHDFNCWARTCSRPQWRKASKAQWQVPAGPWPERPNRPGPVGSPLGGIRAECLGFNPSSLLPFLLRVLQLLFTSPPLIVSSASIHLTSTMH